MQQTFEIFCRLCKDLIAQLAGVGFHRLPCRCCTCFHIRPHHNQWNSALLTEGAHKRLVALGLLLAQTVVEVAGHHCDAKLLTQLPQQREQRRGIGAAGKTNQHTISLLHHVVLTDGLQNLTAHRGTTPC